MKRLVKPFLYATAVMLVSVSCKKEEPNPLDDGIVSCAAGDLYDWVLITKFENEPADVSRSALLFKRGFNLGGGYSPDPLRYSILLCELSDDKVKGLEQTYIFTNEYMQNPRYLYRVWGRIFWARGISDFTGVPILRTQIDKVERIP
ncbi:hypothetical protein [Runella sp. SP2]|uniref:hypothetical protein n=1 Tax=Runella sp. SP2 TaxID=2268026 RepID=UPI000F07DEEA|nr:hypothetical protein [Runella sp. SP2]AYQ34479.1 hypothetical protein DTQ70_20955 [Runella sp. SP2]